MHVRGLAQRLGMRRKSIDGVRASIWRIDTVLHLAGLYQMILRKWKPNLIRRALTDVRWIKAILQIVHQRLIPA
jgi:hypothetical protein